MENKLEEQITLIPLESEYNSSGKSKVAKVSSKIISGVGSYYMNNLNKAVADRTEIETKTAELDDENNEIEKTTVDYSDVETPKEELASSADENSEFTTDEEKLNSTTAEKSDYKEKTAEIFNKLSDVNPEKIDSNSVDTEDEANKVEVSKDEVLNMKKSWNDFRLIYNDNTNENINKSDENQVKTVSKASVETNFDGVFDSLATDINGANEYIINMMNSKDKMDKLNKNLQEQAKELDKKQKDFEEYADLERSSIEKEKLQANQIIEAKRNQLQNEEIQFVQQTEASIAEFELKEESLKIEFNQLNKEKEQMANQKLLDEETIRNERIKFELEKEQFEKEKSLADEKTKNIRAELEDMKSQFETEKEIELRKIELEKKSLAQSCERFKELISQFNMGVGQIPNEED